MAPRRRQQNNEAEELASFLAETDTSSSSAGLCFWGNAVVMALLPVVLFHGVYDMSVFVVVPLYAIVTGLGAFLVHAATVNIAKAEGVERGEKNAMAKTLFKTNAIFLVLFNFFSFFILKAMSMAFNYMLAVLLSAVFLFLTSAGSK